MDYATWQKRLFDHLVIGQGVPGKPLYLYVDRNDLAEVSGRSPEDAVADFCNAYNNGLGVERDESFKHEWLQRDQQTPPDQAPGYFLALVMSVLAVTEPELGGTGGVYPRQRALLGLDPIAQQPKGYTDHVPDLWRAWNRWLEQDGARYGDPTARTHPNWVQQGWARSQGLFRRADRALIRRWFEESGRPNSRAEAEWLLPAFRNWLAAQPDGEALARKIGEPAAAELLAEVMMSLPEDPEVVAGKRPRVVRGLMTFERWRREFGVAIAVPKALDGETILVDGDPTELEEEELVDVATNVDPRTILEAGISVAAGRNVTVRAGGLRIYLMKEVWEVEREVQTHSLAVGATYSAFVATDREEEVLDALKGAGAVSIKRQGVSSAPGWVRCAGIVVTRPLADDALRVLGLTPLAAPRIRLQGGLQVSPGVYLSSALPLVVLPEVAADVHVDGSQVAVEYGYVVRLPALKPGRHVVTCGDNEYSFASTDGPRTGPGYGDAGHGFVVLDRVGLIKDSVEDVSQHATAIRGAELIGQEPPRRTLIRRFHDGDVYVLTEEGRLFLIQEPDERWIKEADLTTGYVEAERIVRELPGTPAFVVCATPGNGWMKVHPLPPDVVPDPGKVPHRQIVNKAFLAKADVSGLSGEGRRQWSHAVTTPSPSVLPAKGAAKPVAAASAVATRYTSTDPVTPSRPLDVALRWLSERDSPSIGLPTFRENWQSLTSDITPDLALYFLELLGHLEVDYSRNRATLAKPTVALLERSGGLAVLCGSRPRILVEALLEQDHPVAAVAEASMHWEVHARAPIDAGAWNPASIYLQWDPAHHQTVVRGLQALGIGISNSPSRAILKTFPDIDQYLQIAPLLTTSPSRTIWRAGPDRQWIPASADDQAGFYRYATTVGSQFCWRGQDGELRRIDHRVGRFLQTRLSPPKGEVARRALQLMFAVHEKRLLVPRVHPLPPLLARGLVLRSGLLPGERRQSPEDKDPPIDYLEYQNVGLDEVAKVARLVGRTYAHAL